jgi:hypothetical protein
MGNIPKHMFQSPVDASRWVKKHLGVSKGPALSGSQNPSSTHKSPHVLPTPFQNLDLTEVKPKLAFMQDLTHCECILPRMSSSIKDKGVGFKNGPDTSLGAIWVLSGQNTHGTKILAHDSHDSPNPQWAFQWSTW